MIDVGSRVRATKDISFGLGGLPSTEPEIAVPKGAEGTVRNINHESGVAEVEWDTGETHKAYRKEYEEIIP